jgi:hypothetical protein
VVASFNKWWISGEVHSATATTSSGGNCERTIGRGLDGRTAYRYLSFNTTPAFFFLRPLFSFFLSFYYYLYNILLYILYACFLFCTKIRNKKQKNKNSGLFISSFLSLYHFNLLICLLFNFKARLTSIKYTNMDWKMWLFY